MLSYSSTLKHLVLVLLLFANVAGQTQKKGLNPISASGDIQPTANNSARSPKNQWGLIIGVSNYENKKIRSLNYAASDAKKFYDFLRSKNGNEFVDEKDGGHLKLLTDQDATKQNITNELNKLNSTTADDFVIIFYSGHGFIPRDAEDAYIAANESDSEQVNSLIGIKDVIKVASTIKARNVLLLFDACHSGGIRTPNGIDFQNPSIDETDRDSQNNLQFLKQANKNVGIITSSSRKQLSWEVAQYGGIFTHSLIEGLSGSADKPVKGSRRDNSIEFDELLTYLENRVPEIINIELNSSALSEYKIEQNPKGFYSGASSKDPLIITSIPVLAGAICADNCGYLKLRAPEIQNVQVYINDNLVHTLNNNIEHTFKLPEGIVDNVSFRYNDSPLKTVKINIVKDNTITIEINRSFDITPRQEQQMYIDGKYKIDTINIEEREFDRQIVAGWNEFYSNKFDKAISTVRHIKKDRYHDNDVMASNRIMGLSFYMMDDLISAKKHFTAVLQYNKEDFLSETFLYDIALRYQYKLQSGINNELDLIVLSLEKIAIKHPTFDFVRSVLAEAYLLKHADVIGNVSSYDGNLYFAKAELQARIAVSLSPESPNTHKILARILSYSEKIKFRKKAIDEAKTALDLYDNQRRNQVLVGLSRLSINHIIFGKYRANTKPNDRMRAEYLYWIGFTNFHYAEKLITNIFESYFSSQTCSSEIDDDEVEQQKRILLTAIKNFEESLRFVSKDNTSNNNNEDERIQECLLYISKSFLLLEDWANAQRYAINLESKVNNKVNNLNFAVYQILFITYNQKSSLSSLQKAVEYGDKYFRYCRNLNQNCDANFMRQLDDVKNQIKQLKEG
jgi:hypothetical protein